MPAAAGGMLATLGGIVDLFIDSRGFVWLDGVKLPMKYLPEFDCFEFVIKDPRVADFHGGRFIRVSPQVLGSISVTIREVGSE